MIRRDWPANKNGLPAVTIWSARDLDRVIAIARAARSARLETFGPRRGRYGYEVQVTCTPAQADTIESETTS